MTEGIFFDTSARFLTFNLKKWYFSSLYPYLKNLNLSLQVSKFVTPNCHSKCHPKCHPKLKILHFPLVFLSYNCPVSICIQTLSERARVSFHISPIFARKGRVQRLLSYAQ